MELLMVTVLALLLVESLRLEYEVRAHSNVVPSRFTLWLARAFAVVSGMAIVVLSAVQFWPRRGGPEPW